LSQALQAGGNTAWVFALVQLQQRVTQFGLGLHCGTGIDK